MNATGGPRYYTIAKDASGDDEGSLIHELMAYASHGIPHQGLFMMWDLSLPNQRESARPFIQGMSNRLYNP